MRSMDRARRRFCNARAGVRGRVVAPERAVAGRVPPAHWNFGPTEIYEMGYEGNDISKIAFLCTEFCPLVSPVCPPVFERCVSAALHEAPELRGVLVIVNIPRLLFSASHVESDRKPESL